MKVAIRAWHGTKDCQVLIWSEYYQAWFEAKKHIPNFKDLGEAMIAFSASPPECLELAKKLINDPQVTPIKLRNIDFDSPIQPSKIICVGLNYADHAKEFNDPIPSEPVIFNKAVTALNGHLRDIELPRVSKRVDYEGELVVVIGKMGHHIPQSKALEYVAGYTCGNDVSARDWQKDKPGGQWFLGKSFDTFAPVGPAFVTADEIPNPNNLSIETRLNGNVMQSSNTSNFIFPVEKIVSYVSNVMTLHRGDLIFTGTPGGVGERRNPPVYLKRGDIIEVEIEKIGTLRNTVEKE